MYCKACGQQLGDPEEVLHDPEGISGIIPEGVSNPESFHIKVVGGSKGPRFQCAEMGQFTKIVDQPPGKQSASEEKSSEKAEPRPESDEPPSDGGGDIRQPEAAQVYDLKEETDPMQLLEGIIATPVFGLDDPQINEVMSWGEIYDGQIPPGELEQILKNLDGVSKQKASLMRQKYEAKLSRWVREQSQDSGGPSIGAMAGSQAMFGNQGQSGPRGPRPPNQPPPSGGPPPEGESVEKSEKLPEDDNLREMRRKRRTHRRHDAMDEAMDQFAHAAAENMAQEFGQFFSESRDILFTVLRKKAEKDPEWFFEKAEQWDMDILDAVMTPSDARRQEMQGGGGQAGGAAQPSQPSTDSEVDDVLAQMDMDEAMEPEPEQEEVHEPPPPEQRRAKEPENDIGDNHDSMDDSPMTAGPEDSPREEDDEDEDSFDELMGDIAED